MDKQVEMNEMGLLSYNYDVEEPSGQIGDNSNNDIKKNIKDTNKEPMISPKDKTNIVNAQSPSSSSSKTKMNQCQQYCTGIFYWIPIRNLCFFGALALFILPFLDDKFGSPTVIEWFLGWYIQGFAILSMFIESPTWFITKRVQLWVFFYARFLRRMSGRAGFYIFFSIVTFAGAYKITITMFAGIYMILMSILMSLFSFLTAKELHLMYNYMIDGDIFDKSNPNDVKQLQDRLISYYNQIDIERSKKIGSTNLYKFAQQSLNKKLSNAERYTLQCYLDVSCNGYITPQDWVKQFIKSNTVKML